MGKRGRPSEEDHDLLNGLIDGEVGNKHFKRKKEGTKTTYTFIYPNETLVVVHDTSVSKNGAISMEYIPNENAEVEEPKTTGQELDNDSLPKTQRKYFNPINGKYVSYQRYHNLIKEGKISPQN